jgi:hypothetical protein
MKKLFLLTLSAITLATTAAEAYITPGPRPPPYPGRPGPGPGRPPRPYPPQNPGYSVPVYVNRRMYGNDRLDLTQYLDLYQYRGYRLVAIDFIASAAYNTALVDVLINGFQTGPTTNLNPYNQSYRVYPNGTPYIGQGADSIVFYTRGDSFIQQVTLQIAR